MIKKARTKLIGERCILMTTFGDKIRKLREYIDEVGFLPLFKHDIDGFSLERRTVPEYWWSDNPEIDPWI